ncbi:MAG: 4Fe-4S dicluster domain-containing protein [Ignavibacteriales bacterium]|nr:MAG: 4Fe-4S dicluster domain-containing protein [Ignavibacteriales bacterium]
MSNSENNLKEANYWKSLKELGEHPESFEAKANEFMKGVTEDFDVKKLSGLSRRKFLALLGASTTFAAASCSNYNDKGQVIPYNKKPDEITPGVSNFYASTCNGCSQACGVLIKTREGRPVKIDGNPDHPVNKGKICSIGQASILDLYDPNRLRKPLTMSDGFGFETSFGKIDDEVLTALNNAVNNGKEISVITHIVASPSQKKLFDDFIAKYPTTKIYSYELFDDLNKNLAWNKSYGSSQFPVIKWSDAKIIVALESDFLGNEGNTVENIRHFSEKRDIMKSKSFVRLYSIEGDMSLTGMTSDYRIKVKPEMQLEFVLSLVNEVGKKIGQTIPVAEKYDLNDFVKRNNLSGETVTYLVNDLIKNRGAGIVYAGDRLPEGVHLVVNYLNEILGNSKLYDTNESIVSFLPLSGDSDIENLITNLNTGKVGVVIHFDTNPVYHFAKGFGYEKALTKADLVVSLVESENETSVKSKYVIPVNHDYESWNDFNVRSGVFSFQQPVISPLYGTRQKEAVLLTWISGSKNNYKEDLYHKYLMDNWEKNLFPALNLPMDFKTFWYASLEVGVITSASTPKTFAFNQQSINTIKLTESKNSLSLVLKPAHSINDGRYANNGWLQELPHPVSKIVWDNYASVSPSTAKKYSLDENDIIEVSVENRKIKIPVSIQPGLADELISIELGYGRTKAGEVGEEVGVNANVLIAKRPIISKWIYTDVRITKTGDSHKLVSTQEKHSLDDTFLKDLHLERKIIKEGTLAEYRKNPSFLFEEKGNPLNIYKDIDYKGVKWGMAIDLNKCLGCNQCTVACNVENNIPVVGKDQVDAGRDMHWLRIDRYYSGSPDEPKVSLQPMLCQHCDNAPCENVCPVAATNHSPDGLNQMVYNRCVGTRYCSNNCPYKVRRYNFFNFRDRFADGYYEQEPFNLVNNPEVTVRSRGVMEKCTFCIQRIMEARQHAIEEGRPLNGNDVKTACQVACPAEAIVFGDVNDPHSEISKYREHELGYHVLQEINTRPNVTYIAKLRNTYSEEA